MPAILQVPTPEARRIKGKESTLFFTIHKILQGHTHLERQDKTKLSQPKLENKRVA